MTTTLQFLGAAGSVTGSKFLLEVDGRRLLVDCGLPSIEQVVLTHAHIAHSGYLPRLCRDGFHGTVHATAGTADLLKILPPIADQLQRVMATAFARGGALVVPAFAVGRTQDLLYYLSGLEHAHQLPRVPIYLDSPMAVNATSVYRQHPEEFDEDMRARLASGRSPLAWGTVRIARTVTVRSARGKPANTPSTSTVATASTASTSSEPSCGVNAYMASPHIVWIGWAATTASPLP
jgi:Cft2 family RNA processing exonuclease